ncbi:MAG: hypothetical protein ACFBSC_19070 [Microcoleaceae cyanobacterium]
MQSSGHFNLVASPSSIPDPHGKITIMPFPALQLVQLILRRQQTGDQQLGGHIRASKVGQHQRTTVHCRPSRISSDARVLAC